MNRRAQIESRLQLQTLALQAAANGIIITDDAGQIEWANPAFAAMTGYAVDEIMGQTPRFLKSGKQADAFYRSMWETIVAGYVWSGEVVNRRKDGSLYVEEQTITPVLDENGKPAHFIAIKHDITGRRQAEDELRRRHQELTILNLVGSALSGSLVLSDVLASCRGLLASMLEGAGGAVYLLTGRTLKLETAWGECEREGHSQPPAQSACLEETMASRSVLVHPDRICVPLLAQGQLRGDLEPAPSPGSRRARCSISPSTKRSVASSGERSKMRCSSRKRPPAANGRRPSRDASSRLRKPSAATFRGSCTTRRLRCSWA